MITQADLQYLNGADVYAPDGTKIGSAGQVYLDDRTGAPKWVSVRTGLLGTKESFVPLEKATLADNRLEVPFDKTRVKDAPRVDDDRDLSPADADKLHTYYGLGSGRDSGDTGKDTSGPNTDTAMTRSEEHLVAGTRTEQSGTARLRKYVVTEQQSATVPVSHEEVRIEREPITEGNVGAALDGPAISEEEHELTLSAERPVVTTETVPVERIKLNKKTVTDQETVSGEVRKEQIDVDGDSAPGQRR
ncbi:DUF2382 domain-containing protein [Nucisporomicrobium flavum]|uniref:DUF2382 domain-containing protein n=1 Tax=Nucisporomicrobium flavum TaxID=2785915 RepID=UPI0018F51D20|nr:PRC and DUF2382 domain-containing protein [Nucisporomicrobium flavum]